MKKLILVLTLIGFWSNVNAFQSGYDQQEPQKKWPYFKGVVLDFVTGNPIQGAKASIEGTSLAAITNQKGEFEFERLTPGAINVLMTHSRYQPLLWKNIPIENNRALYRILIMKTGSANDKPLVGLQQSSGSSVIDEDAVPILTREASYPLQALKERIEGTVLLFVTVNEDGEVLYARVKDSVREDLNLAALEAVQHFKFKPAKVKGRPVEVMVTVPFNFKLADKASEYPFKLVNGPLTNEDISSALDYLGVQMYRFSYEIPFKHKLRLCLDRYLHGKLIDSKSTGSGPQDPGKNNVTIFKYTKDDSVQFTFSLSSAGSAKRITFNKISVKEYPSAGWIPYFDVHMQSGKKTPFYMFALSPGALKFSKDEPLDSIISKIKFVVVGSVELRLD